MLRAFGLSLLAFLGGTIVIYLAVVFAVLGYWELTGYHDREGAGSMGLIFILGPGLALPSGIVIAIVTWIRSRRRATDAALT